LGGGVRGSRVMFLESPEVRSRGPGSWPKSSSQRWSLWRFQGGGVAWESLPTAAAGPPLPRGCGSAGRRQRGGGSGTSRSGPSGAPPPTPSPSPPGSRRVCPPPLREGGLGVFPPSRMDRNISECKRLGFRHFRRITCYPCLLHCCLTAGPNCSDRYPPGETFPPSPHPQVFGRLLARYRPTPAEASALSVWLCAPAPTRRPHPPFPLPYPEVGPHTQEGVSEFPSRRAPMVPSPGRQGACQPAEIPNPPHADCSGAKRMKHTRDG